MSEILEKYYRVEAPAALWQRVGSTAVFALADIGRLPPGHEEFLEQTFDTWHKEWTDDCENHHLLKVRQLQGRLGPASLLISDRTSVYTHHIFSALPFTTEDSGYMASLQGVVDLNNSEETQAKLQEGLELGTALCTKNDVERLYDTLGLGPSYFV